MASTQTTTTKANRFKMVSDSNRPATSGNKNISMGARRMSAESQKSKIAAGFAATHTGPFLGRRSV